VRIACPLYALSPRMRELEKALSAQDRIALFLDAAKLQADVARATGRPVQVWNRPADASAANSPTRALRSLLSADEGGTDKEDRLKRFRADLVPWSSIVLALEQLKLGRDYIAEPAFAQLVHLAGDLFEKYDVQPAELLLRGREIVPRLDRVRGFLEDDSLVTQADDAELQKAVAGWREQAKAAYEALAANHPTGKSQVNKLWAEDLYLLSLLQVDSEERPERSKKIDSEERPERYKKMALTRILAYAVRGPLSQRVLWLRAMLWQDKAERDQVLAGAKGAPKGAAINARNAWLNTGVAWDQYLDRADLSPAARTRRLEAVRALAKRDGPGPAYAGNLLEGLHLDLHRAFAARVSRARATSFLDGAKAAVAPLRGLQQEVDALLEKGKDGSPAVVAADVRQRLHDPKAAPLVRSLELLERDWAPQGYVDWLGRHVRRQVEVWEQPDGNKP
jgi:hypothetical protein